MAWLITAAGTSRPRPNCHQNSSSGGRTPTIPTTFSHPLNGESPRAIRRRFSRLRNVASLQFLRRVVIERLFPFPRRLKLALAPVRWMKKLGLKAAWLPAFARDALALVPDKANAATLPEYSSAVAGPQRGRVGFISGCVMSVM